MVAAFPSSLTRKVQLKLAFVRLQAETHRTSCSSVAMSLLAAHVGKSPWIVSQSLNVLFHSPAKRHVFFVCLYLRITDDHMILSGCKLRIVSTTIAIGSRIVSARCEVRKSISSTRVNLSSP